MGRGRDVIDHLRTWQLNPVGRGACLAVAPDVILSPASAAPGRLQMPLPGAAASEANTGTDTPELPSALFCGAVWSNGSVDVAEPQAMPIPKVRNWCGWLKRQHLGWQHLRRRRLAWWHRKICPAAGSTVASLRYKIRCCSYHGTGPGTYGSHPLGTVKPTSNMVNLCTSVACRTLRRDAPTSLVLDAVVHLE